ncbi:MAG: hypothetical protein FWG89_02725 [Treponema sp.]|nr:hypothetical protein [Treponema sp.]
MNRKILIVTDNSDQMRKLAAKITAVIMNPPFEQYSVTETAAENFSAEVLLPAPIFFLGCQSKESFSNPYIETLFTHINLAGRTCGIFSANTQAVKYLKTLVRDTGVTAGKPLLVHDDTIDDTELQNWVQGIVQTVC